jgi:hypothetical protein
MINMGNSLIGQIKAELIMVPRLGKGYDSPQISHLANLL